MDLKLDEYVILNNKVYQFIDIGDYTENGIMNNEFCLFIFECVFEDDINDENDKILSKKICNYENDKILSKKVCNDDDVVEVVESTINKYYLVNMDCIGNVSVRSVKDNIVIENFLKVDMYRSPSDLHEMIFSINIEQKKYKTYKQIMLSILSVNNNHKILDYYLVK